MEDVPQGDATPHPDPSAVKSHPPPPGPTSTAAGTTSAAGAATVPIKVTHKCAAWATFPGWRGIRCTWGSKGTAA